MNCPCKTCVYPKRTSVCHIEGNCLWHDEWQKFVLETRKNREKALMKKDMPPESLKKWWKKMKKPSFR